MFNEHNNSRLQLENRRLRDVSNLAGDPQLRDRKDSSSGCMTMASMPLTIKSLYWGERNQIQPPLQFFCLPFLKSCTLWHNFSGFKSEQPIENHKNLTIVNLYMLGTMGFIKWFVLFHAGLSMTSTNSFCHKLNILHVTALGGIPTLDLKVKLWSGFHYYGF